MMWWFLVGCGLFVTEDDLLSAIDLDGDGYQSPAYGGGDCNDADPSVYPGAPDVPYDGVDSDCAGNDDDDADGDGLAAVEQGGLDCDDTDPSVGDDPVFFYADCDGDGVPADDGLFACAAPVPPLPLEIDPCQGAPRAAFVSVPPVIFDCDDRDPNRRPSTPDDPVDDPWYDGVDADCGGENDYDRDGDGFVAAVAGAVPDASAPGVGDCDDLDPDVHPEQVETWYDGIDADCDGANDYDADGDRVLDLAWPDETGGTAPFAGDCDDLDPDVRPGAPDTPYDGLDSDCGGGNDYDGDGDGWIAEPHVAYANGLPVGDCDDTDPARHPEADERPYDGIDADCDGANDFDQDGDGVVASAFPDEAGGSAPATGDCDDTDGTAYPGATDTPYDGVDADCDGSDDYDLDGDGYAAQRPGTPPGLVDCDDTDPDVFPGAPDAPYDGLDADCAGDDDYDQDGDGSVPDAWAAQSPLPAGDCDDTDPDRSPLLPELWYDGVDRDCLGDSDYDRDQDGYVAAAWPDEAVDGLLPGDCNDGDPAQRPGLPDTWYDGIDTDCDGANDYDRDGDGAVRLGDDVRAGGTAPYTGDCNDQSAAIGPLVDDAPYDGVDANCDGANDYDGDGDGYVALAHAAQAGGTAPFPGDCDDTDPAILPGGLDVPYDGVDGDCQGDSDYDVDGDGYVPLAYAGFAGPSELAGDCDDALSNVNPGAVDLWYDGVDADCDGANDYDQDGDGFVRTGDDAFAGGSAPSGGDCDDVDPTRFPGAADPPYDGVDGDCDGQSDDDLDGDGVTGGPSCVGICDCDDGDPTLDVGTRTVSPGEDLQDLVDRACDDAVLTLLAGTHPVDDLQLDRPILLEGAGSSAAGTLLEAGAGRAVTIGGSASLSALRVQGGSADDGGCLQVRGTALLDDVVIRSCTATGSGGAIYVAGGALLDATGLVLSSSDATTGGGLAVAPSGRADLFASRVESTTATTGGAISVDAGELLAEDLDVVSTEALGDGGGIWAQDADVDLIGVVFDRSIAGGHGGAVLSLRSGGLWDDVEALSCEANGPVVSIGADPLPAILQLDYAGLSSPIVALSRLRVEGGSAYVGLSIFEPKTLVSVDDAWVDGFYAYGVSAETQPGLLGGSGQISFRNLLSAGSTTAMRLDAFDERTRVEVENATLVGANTGLWGMVFGASADVRNVLATATNSASWFPRDAIWWTDFASSSIGGTWMSNTAVLDGTSATQWSYIGSIYTSSTTTPYDQPFAFCSDCSGVLDRPLDPVTYTLSGPLVGTGDPTLCPVGATAQCFDPGYWGGPAAP